VIHDNTGCLLLIYTKPIDFSKVTTSAD